MCKTKRVLSGIVVYRNPDGTPNGTENDIYEYVDDDRCEDNALIDLAAKIFFEMINNEVKTGG